MKFTSSDVGEVHKSTVLGMLNASHQGLSNDRPKRVRSKHISVSVASLVNVSNEIGLFDDVAVSVRQGKKKAVQLARVVRMRNKAKKFIKFKKTVSLDAKS